MTNNFEAVPAAKHTGDENFFKNALACRELQEEILNLEAKLNQKIGQRSKLGIGELMPLARLEEIRGLSRMLEEKKEELSKMIESLVSQFYPENTVIRDSLKGVWIGVKPNTAFRLSDDFKSIEVNEWPQ